MTASRFLFLYLWVAPHALQIPIVVIMVRRKMVREFPIFFVYTCFQILQCAVLFTMDQVDYFTGDQYVPTWLAAEYISVALRFAVIHEIFNTVFQSYPAVQQLGGRLFRWSTVLLMVAAVLLVAYSSGSNLDRVTFTMSVVNRGVNIMQVGLLILLVLLVRYLRFPWNTFFFSCALGLGLFASVMLATSVVRAHYGAFFERTLMDDIENAGYHCAVILWLTGLVLPARATQQIESPRAPEVEHWNAALQRLLEQ
jgi:hypothetical protein